VAGKFASLDIQELYNDQIEIHQQTWALSASGRNRKRHGYGRAMSAADVSPN
jgi:hypothetical protein